MLLTFVVIFNAIPVQAAIVLTTKPLVAGKGPYVGSVTVAIEGSNLVVTYQVPSGVEITETHLYVGTVPPTKNAPGKFPYIHYDLGGVPSDQYSIPLSELGAGSGDTLYIAAHAVLRKWMGLGWLEETAWACGVRFGKGWALGFSVTIP